MTKKILVIGGLGFIGSRLCDLLNSAGHTVTILDKRAGPLDAINGVQYIVGDVRVEADVVAAMNGVDVVFNLAAEHQDDVRPLSLYYDVNVLGAATVGRAAAAAEVRQIIFTSSVAIYGSQSSPMTEDAPHLYFNEYGRTKLLAEKELIAWAAEDAVRSLTIVRPTVVFGPGNKGNVFNLLRQIKHGPFVMFGTGQNRKSLAHVENVSQFLSASIDNGPGVNIFNYSDRPDYTMNELVALVYKGLGRNPQQVLRFPLWLGIVGGNIADLISKLIGRPLPISAIRVQKFCAPSQIDSSKAFRTGFKAETPLAAALVDMVSNV
jgi:nucleoside-diphosphate-sugar epimerase